MVRILFSYEDIIAKTNKTSLETHLLDTYNILKILLKSNEDLLQNWAVLNDVDLEIFQNNLEMATYFHDFGKATNIWQTKAHNKIKDNSVNLPPHAFYSGYFLSSKFKNFEDSICLLSCISHHSLLTENSFNSINNNNNIKYYEDYLENLVLKNDFIIEKFDSLQDYSNKLENFKKKSQNENQLRHLFEKKINILFKAKYCLMLSYLTTADGLSSYFEENKSIISENSVLKRFPNSKIIYNKIKNIESDKKLTDIQKSIAKIKSEDNCDLIRPILMEAPCGEGKTLASLLFSKKLFEKNIINKIIFALPTQVTSNNMFTEFKEEYNIPQEWIGIYHSEVLSFLSKLKDAEDNEIFDNVYFEKHNNLIYSKQFNVSTIDHLLLSLVNGFKFAPRAFGNMLNSLIIIDELHYYDSRTIILIEVLCKILRFLKIPHIIMSATIPKHIKNKFSNDDYLKIQSSGCDIEGIEKSPFELQYHEDLIYDDGKISDEFLKLIEDNIDKNIGIIVNTVPKSKDLYEYITNKFPDEQILLYNAQFMKKDRPIKEKILKNFSKVIYNNKLNSSERGLMEKYGYDSNKKFIFIGTQVAEISINMSFDILISEIAPLDALIQRGGRLHRTKTYNSVKECGCSQCKKLTANHEYIFHIFDTGEFCYPYLVKEDVESQNYKVNIINNTRNVIKNSTKFTFKNSISMMDKVYDKNSFSEDSNVFNEYKEKIVEDLIFGKSPSFSEESDKPLRIQTRDINVKNFLVLPQIICYNGEEIFVRDFLKKICCNYNFKGKLTQKGMLIINKYMININSQYYHTIKGKPYHYDNYFFKIVNKNYNFEKGLCEEDVCL